MQRAGICQSCPMAPFCHEVYRILIPTLNAITLQTLGKSLKHSEWCDLTTRGPGVTSLTWVILANISHINTCKVTFLYSGPNCSGTMTLTTWFWLDHLTIKFELFWLSGFLKRFSKTSPLKQMKKCFTLLWPLITPGDPFGKPRTIPSPSSNLGCMTVFDMRLHLTFVISLPAVYRFRKT
jgi:hypothetical protein